MLSKCVLHLSVANARKGPRLFGPHLSEAQSPKQCFQLDTSSMRPTSLLYDPHLVSKYIFYHEASCSTHNKIVYCSHTDQHWTESWIKPNGLN